MTTSCAFLGKMSKAESNKITNGRRVAHLLLTRCPIFISTGGIGQGEALSQCRNKTRFHQRGKQGRFFLTWCQTLPCAPQMVCLSFHFLCILYTNQRILSHSPFLHDAYCFWWCLELWQCQCIERQLSHALDSPPGTTRSGRCVSRRPGI